MKITEETKIQDCDLSVYLKRILIASKIEKVSDLLNEDKSRLITYRGIGKTTYKEIIFFVNSNNFEFNN